MKKYLIVFFVILFFASSSFVTAKEGVGQGQLGQGEGQGNYNEDSNSVENKNQLQIQNQGEEQALQVENQEQEESQFQEDGESSRSGLIDEANNKLQGLKNIENQPEEVKTQLNEMVQNQEMTQIQLKTQYDKLNNRKGLIKLLIGPDFKALLDAKKELQQVEVRIKQLEELKNQLVNTGEETMIEEAIQALINQQTFLQNELKAQESSFSFFGWFFRFFNK